jgi:hypothetical protein
MDDSLTGGAWTSVIIECRIGTIGSFRQIQNFSIKKLAFIHHLELVGFLKEHLAKEMPVSTFGVMNLSVSCRRKHIHGGLSLEVYGGRTSDNRTWSSC